jgi:hypothetical protein
MTQFKLSPSDLTFLWDECPRCFYLKVARGFNRPRTPFPSIFTRIDGLMKSFFQDRLTSELAPELPPGRVHSGDKWVQSTLIHLPGRSAACYLRGKFDTAVEFDDGSFGVVDFKTSEPKPQHAEFYGRQLHAYAYALEHPAAGKFTLSPITRLGLLVVEPNDMDRVADGRIAYLGAVTWVEIPYNEAGFLEFIEEVLALLEAPEPPPPAEKCGWCQYRESVRAVPY